MLVLFYLWPVTLMMAKLKRLAYKDYEIVIISQNASYFHLHQIWPWSLYLVVFYPYFIIQPYFVASYWMHINLMKSLSVAKMQVAYFAPNLDLSLYFVLFYPYFISSHWLMYIDNSGMQSGIIIVRVTKNF